MAYNTRLGTSEANFDSMMKGGFGIVTVMNANVYDIASLTKEGVFTFEDKTAYDIATTYGVKKESAQGLDGYRCTLDTLKVANITMEGPSKTVTGGRYSNPLIKFGKSARLEMQDALGSSEALETLCGGIQEFNGTVDSGTVAGLHFGEDFASPKLIVGDSFFIDRKTGKQIKVKIIFYQFLPDSIFNLTQDAEGDATVFDMNGDLLTTEIMIGKDGTNEDIHGVFYSIVNPEEDGTIVTPALVWKQGSSASTQSKIDAVATAKTAPLGATFIVTKPDGITEVAIASATEDYTVGNGVRYKVLDSKTHIIASGSVTVPAVK